MKVSLYATRCAKHISHGFALIATITLMMLLALLSVGLLTIASSQIRMSEKQLFASEAKSLARLSLQIAIGQLQCELGPDQRISANSGILSSDDNGNSSPYILGVWNSWDSWLNRQNSAGQNIASTYTSGRSSMFRRWLISDPDFNKLSTPEAAKNSLGRNEKTNGKNHSILLLGPGTLGTEVSRKSQDKREVYAKAVQVVDFSRGNKGARDHVNRHKFIAWWVSAENQKARINLMPHASEENTDTLTAFRSTWDTPGPDLESLGLSTMIPAASSSNQTSNRKLISMDTVLVNSNNGRLKDLGNHYHDVSLVSKGLLTDVKFGGLKKDLNILFSQDKLPEDFTSTTADVGLRPYSSEDGNPSNQQRPIGSWNQLYLWANVWDSSTKRDGQDDSAALLWEGQTPKTLIASDASANLGIMDNRNTYMRHPILLRYYNFVGIQYIKHGNKHPNRGGWIDVRLSVIPVYVWWNPYNVDMSFSGAGGSLWGGYFGEHRFMPLLLSHNIKFAWNQLDENALNSYSENLMAPYIPISYNNRQIADFGASFRDTSTLNSDGSPNKGNVPTLKAGEMVIFAQPVVPNFTSNNPVYKAKLNNADFASDRFPMKEGWSQDPGQVSAYAINMTDGVRYELLEGSGYNSVGVAKASVRFAADTSELTVTPKDHVMGVKYADNAQNTTLGSFVMSAGIMDLQQIGKTTAQAGSGTKDIEIFSKTMPALLKMNWGAWEEPLVDQIKFPIELWENNVGPNEEGIKSGEYGTPSLDSTFVAYYGVSVKWGKQPVIGTYPEGKDYRAKIWQHSSPLFWGNQMKTASELGRTYSPYQFEVKQANSNFYPITISNILSNDGTRLSPFGGPGAEQVNKIIAAELPFQQPYSLAGFAGCRLTPGWYKTDSKAAVAKRFAYQSGVPGVGIGNSFADPMLPADKIFSHNEITGDSDLGDFWDHGFMINDALWDSWFTSSLAKRPQSYGSAQKQELTEVLKEAFNTDITAGKASGIANRRFIPDLRGKPSESVISELSDSSSGYKRSAKYLNVAGSFNVNSTSEAAWEATLMGLKKRKLLQNNGGQPKTISNNQVNFSRFGVATNDKSHVDDYGSIGVTNGISDGEAMAWSDLRTLSDSQIKALAKNIVKEIKKRGPFLNMADFINRRLESGEMGLKGALQAAIDESSINSVFDGLSDMMVNPQVAYPNVAAAKGSVYTAAPGYLIQSDVLSVLGNILTTRDDTFTIRAYGELTNKEGVILSRAWCEAVVQRGLQYVDPSNTPETPAIEVNMKTGALEDSQLTPINRAFGRKFRVISFRWLAPEEV